MNVAHFVQFAQTAFLPLLADAAGMIFGIVTVASVLTVFVRAFGTFNR